MARDSLRAKPRLLFAIVGKAEWRELHRYLKLQNLSLKQLCTKWILDYIQKHRAAQAGPGSVKKVPKGRAKNTV